MTSVKLTSLSLSILICKMGVTTSAPIRHLCSENQVSQGALIRDFPGGPVVRTLHFPCRGHWFNPWFGISGLRCCTTWSQKKDVLSICYRPWKKVRVPLSLFHICKETEWMREERVFRILTPPRIKNTRMMKSGYVF